MGRPLFDVWICQGRMCSAHGADALVEETRADEGERCRVLRGGCYGLCEIGPNVVVRRFAKQRAGDDDADRLTLTGAENETVYSRIGPAEMVTVLRSHLDRDAPLPALTRTAREAMEPPKNDVAARIRALREKRKNDDG